MDIVYNTPQDKLLVMLTEPILNQMKEKLNTQNEILNKQNRLVYQSLSYYFSISLSKKDFDEKLNIIIKYINNKIPIITVFYIKHIDNNIYTIIIQTQSIWMIDTIKEQLGDIYKDLNLSNQYIDINIYTMIRSDNRFKKIATKDIISHNWRFESTP